MTKIEDIKARWDIPMVWRKLGLPGEPKIGMNRSPFREDRNPSFSIYANGQKWKDHASDEQGDVIDLVQVAMDCDKHKALDWFGGGSELHARPPRPKAPAKLVQHDWSPREVRKWEAQYPTELDLQALTDWTVAKRLGPPDLFVEEGSLRVTDHDSVVHFKDKMVRPGAGKPVFVFKQGVKLRNDLKSSRRNYWLTGGNPHNLWRVQALRYEPRLIILVEGETDCMAMANDIGLDRQAEVMGCPGAGWRPEVFIPVFKMALSRGLEHIVVAFDPDEAGRNGQAQVVRALQAAGLPATGESSGHNDLDYSDLQDRDRKKVVSHIFSVAGLAQQ